MQAWGISDKPLLPEQVASMLAIDEQHMLCWMARDHYEGKGDIVDLGAFLGGSTYCLAKGLSENRRVSRRDHRIHSYDLFICPTDTYSRGLIGIDREPGSSVLDIYRRNIVPFEREIVVRPGDVLTQPYSGGFIEILFIDICKTEAVNDAVVGRFIPLLIGPGAIIVHQDYNHPYLPWVHVTTALLRPYCRYLGDASGSKTFVVERSIPSKVIQRCLDASTSFDEKQQILRAEMDATENRYSTAMVAMGSAWLTFLNEGAAVGAQRLDSLAHLFDVEWVPQQVDQMRASMEYLRDRAGFDTFMDGLWPSEQA